MAFYNQLRKITSSFNEVRLVFDRYLKQSLKSRTRKKRTSGQEMVIYQVSGTANISNESLKALLAHIETKQQLTIFLSKYCKREFQGSNIDFAVTYDQITETNMDGFTEELKNHDHEEADTLLILHAIDVARKDIFTECYVYSPDTDVFLLLLHHYESLPLSTYFRTGKGEKERDINIRNCYEGIGGNRAAAVLGLHVLTGCDQTGRFAGKSKSTWWKSFTNADANIIQALTVLGNGEHLPDLFTLEQIERFVVDTYSEGKKAGSISTLAKLRWFLFSKFQHHASQLPPTASALKYKVFRSHYICLNLKRSNVFIQNLPPAQHYGLELNGCSLDAILTDNLPPPLALIELSVCGCKSDCSTRRCKCLKNNLVCTDMCKCLENCSNDGSNEEHIFDEE